MRILLDTCIVIHLALEPERLNRDVFALLYDYDNQLYTSMESVKELIVAFRRKGVGRRLFTLMHSLPLMKHKAIMIQVTT